MTSARGDSCGRLCLVALSVGLWACGQSTEGGTVGTGGNQGHGGTTASGGTGSGGNTGSGGSVGSGGSEGRGGAPGTGGATGSGGRTVSGSGGRGTGGEAGGGGGADAALGGSQGTGGNGPGGATGAGGTLTVRDGGFGADGRMGMDGRLGTGGGTATGGSSGAGGGPGAGGSTGTGDCVKGQTKGSDVVFIGESFIQLSTIPDQVAKNAVAAGSLKQGEKYLNFAVSGMTMAGNNANSIPNQYAKAVQQNGTIKYVLMDGGGNDCLLNNNGDAVLAPAEKLFQNMATNKTEKILYFFYPDPFGSDRAQLKTCLDALRPKMQAMCEGLTAPKCYWLDLRPVWNGHTEYAVDGIHASSAGSVATGDAIWKEMVKNCIAQ